MSGECSLESTSSPTTTPLLFFFLNLLSLKCRPYYHDPVVNVVVNTPAQNLNGMATEPWAVRM